MEENNLKSIIFDLPEDVSLTEIIFSILKNNGLQESEREAFEKSMREEESQLIILRDAAITIAQRKIPEDKLVEFLAKHLGTTTQTAANIVKEINNKIIPYAKLINRSEENEKEFTEKLQTSEEIDEETKKEMFRIAKEELMRKIGAQPQSETTEEQPKTPYDKNIETGNVEENAKTIQHQQQRKEVVPPTNPTPVEPKKEGPVDPYKESIE